jgi:LytS/YehU family sensor histidine kinase
MTIKVADMEKEKIRFELDFLKSQIQPHFFFNVMNTIYFQIDSSNQSARNSIYKLSNIMRYILYESSSEFVDINQELYYISNYFQLQLQRQEFKANIKLNIKVEKNIKIRPHLIMPLIENAFKHKSNNHDSYKNLVNIIIKQNEQNDVIVHVINNYDKKNVYINNVSGIGLENLNKRLTLLYPNRKLLHIHPNIEKKIFKATLIIPYENEMHHH